MWSGIFQFVVIHTVKGFGIVNKAKVDVFLELSCFFDVSADVGSLSSSSVYLAWTSGSSQFMYCWSLAWRILSITLLPCEMNIIVWQFDHSLALPFFGIGMKPCDPTIPLLDINSRKSKARPQRDIRTPVFIATLFTIAKRWNQYFMHIMKCYFAFKKWNSDTVCNIDEP